MVSEQEANVIRQANRLLREEESARQAELNRMQGELDFYQRLAGTSGTQSGLAVYHLELSPSGSGRVFRFVLTLTQNLRRSSITSGKVRINVEGILQHRPVTLPWSQLNDGQHAKPDFRFKYFQQLDGYLVLPQNFQPSRILVTLEASEKNKSVSREFAWDDLLTPDESLDEAPGPEQNESGLEQALDPSSPE